MKTFQLITICLLGTWLTMPEACSQIRLKSGVLANGGGSCSCASFKSTCTVGEPVTGATAGGSLKHGAGFWGAVGSMPLTAVTEPPVVPLSYELSQNYPNPFNPTTNIRYQISDIGYVKLAVYDLLGREVAVLVDEKQPAGNYDVRFNQSGMASGVYIYKLTAGAFVQSRKMLLVR